MDVNPYLNVTSKVLASDPNKQIIKDDAWQDEIGFIGGYNPADESTVNRALLHALIGAGGGALGGAARTKNPYTTGFTTAVGSGLGSMAGSEIGQRWSTKPGGAELSQLLGALAGGGLGFLATHQNKKKSLVPELKAELPGGLQVKTGSVTARQVYGQLPTFRAGDYLAGGVAGGGLGWLYDKIFKNKQLSEEEQRKQQLKRMAIGAGIGGAGTNLTMDRLRRGYSNLITPFGYHTDDKNLSGFKKQEIIDAIFKDKPLPQVVGTPQLDARYELQRRSLGLHVNDPAKDYWQEQGNNIVSLNPRHPKIEENLAAFVAPKQFNHTLNPVEMAKSENEYFKSTSGPNTGGLMDDIVGGQRVSLFPYDGKDYGLTNYEGKTLDRWDLTLGRDEQNSLLNNAHKKFMHTLHPATKPDWSKDEKESAKSMLMRWIADKTLYKDPQWVGQKYHFTQLPKPPGIPVEPRFALTPYTYNLGSYPGKNTFVRPYDIEDPKSEFGMVEQIPAYDLAKHLNPAFKVPTAVAGGGWKYTAPAVEDTSGEEDSN